MGRLGIFLLIGILLLSLAAGAETTYYLNNRPVNGRLVAGELMVNEKDIRRYLTPREMERVELQGSDRVLVDGKLAGTVVNGEVPFLALVRLLGYEQRRSPGLGYVDLVPPGLPAGGGELASASLRRADYREAADRLEMILGVLPEYRDPVLMERANRVGQRVVAVTPLSNLQWKFVVVDSDQPNAACTGEGHVFVTRGLFNLGITDDELAGVIGHEVAHGVRRHCFRVVQLYQNYLNILRDMQALKAKYAAYQRGESTLVSPQSLEAEARAIEQKLDALQDRIDNERVYGRQDEEEADALGLRYAVTAGYAPGGLAGALNKLQSYQVEVFGQAVLDDDMTHPPVRRRLEILRRVQANWR